MAMLTLQYYLCNGDAATLLLYNATIFNLYIYILPHVALKETAVHGMCQGWAALCRAVLIRPVLPVFWHHSVAGVITQ